MRICISFLLRFRTFLQALCHEGTWQQAAHLQERLQSLATDVLLHSQGDRAAAPHLSAAAPLSV